MSSSQWKKDLFKPEIFFSIIILVFGLILILITPVGANYDEETYMARIFEMSLGHVMPNSFLGQGSNYPKVLISNSYRQDVNLWPVDAPTWIDQLKDRINWKNRDSDSLTNYKTRAVYFPTLFVIQAVIMRLIGPVLDLPIVLIYYAIRLSYLILYLILVYLAIKIIPFGKWVLGVITVGPMALILSSSVSPDPIIFGVCFLFVAWILYLIKQTGVFISKKQLIITCGLILAVCSLKPNYIFLLALLFALPKKGFLKKRDIVSLILVSIFGVGISIGWSYIAAQVTINVLDLASDTMPRFLSLFQAPQIFIKSLAQTIAINAKEYMFQAVGVSGYGYWHLPKIVYFLYPIAILMALLIDVEKNIMNLWQKMVFLLTGLINFFVIFILFFVTATPLSSSTIVGMTGRYFIPFILLFLLTINLKKPIKWLRNILMVLLGLISTVTVVALFLAFHIICAGFWMNGQSCKLPYYKNWGPETFIPVTLSKGSALNQNIIVDCKTISEIEIWPLKNEVINNSQVILNLRTGSGDLLASKSFLAAGIPIDQWYSMAIPEVVGMKGKAITIEIVPAEGQDLSEFALGVFPTDEYTKGELFITDGATGKSTTTGNDLIFKYQCEKP